MIQARLALCAETIVRDAENNNISAINIYEELNIAEFPAAISKLSILFMIERTMEDPGQIDAVVVLTLDNEEIGRATMHGDFEGKPRTRLIVVAQNMPIARAGLLTASAIVNNETLSSWSIPIHKAESAPRAETP
jgi:hypothetical protein